MIRPLTCVCLILAAGSGLYLYQVKQRAFALDASLRSTYNAIDEAREHTRMLRADWALVNDPERLQALATQYLTLQPMQPSQLLTMDQLAQALPPPVPSGVTPPAAAKPAAVPGQPAAPIADPTRGMPMAEALPSPSPSGKPAAPEVALLQPAAPQPATPEPAVTRPAAPQPVASATAAPQPAAPQPAAPRPTASDMAIATLPPPRPLHHPAHRPSPETQPWLADAQGYQPARRHADRHAPAPPRQFFAETVPDRGADPAARITPPAATVMYRTSSGSSLGMASSATLAPPRPLYSTAQ